MSIGLFHTRLNVSSSLLGAPVLTLDLLVDTVNKKVSGVASIFQSTYPPLNFRARVWGEYSEAKLTADTENHIILTLDGSPSGPYSQIAQTFDLRGILGADWASGFADYKYYDQDHWTTVRHAAVSQAPAQHPEHPSHVVRPLYAVAVQQAQASGDLAQLKSVVSQGEQQLANSGALRSALEQLQAEIARLEAR
ncbi:DUF1842 domain-containing protein [Pseudomonas sp. FW306-02-F02-AA]|uniref:DUF1842 domain-containing protein n=1 Tax=Pseudomonas fluorescens TaxID=294 RepID=A0A0N9WQ99_PSEFL|nr:MULTISPECIES: DUF1842 domain-containing protein [Pseudomonas]ALI04618.1 hypothetical protein AO353_27510 [Pseudomonas fluorescens]PMZ02313.1 DUF1842 domain-containing protein [Pseudomonas sp. FW306-02-F02-AB]PMZ09095.1 DUF1842 domain-containing protein [Pseudomonas sp. FW306-02-H06C]PMZ14807.1 DUF1842 domain-containing protein [Pseudomonas sp. FW306-02-F02-AA]PMZ19513.1 DUF1842 domain-containing protein [Pseudomonas sp. FW306-02-F08-AA]